MARNGGKDSGENFALKIILCGKAGGRTRRKEGESGREGKKVSRGVGGGGGPDQQQQEEVCVACVCACDPGHDDDRVKEQEEKVRWPNPVSPSELGTVFRI